MKEDVGFETTSNLLPSIYFSSICDQPVNIGFIQLYEQTKDKFSVNLQLSLKHKEYERFKFSKLFSFILPFYKF